VVAVVLHGFNGYIKIQLSGPLRMLRDPDTMYKGSHGEVHVWRGRSHWLPSWSGAPPTPKGAVPVDTVEQRRAVPTNPCPNCRLVSKINDSKPLSVGWFVPQQ
jgi:hypothetical protein